jgi:hypothetical protein
MHVLPTGRIVDVQYSALIYEIRATLSKIFNDNMPCGLFSLKILLHYR